MGALPAKVRVLLAVGALPLMASCSSFGGGSDPAPVADASSAACPRVAIVSDAAEVTEFRPGMGRDLTDVVSRARLVDIRGNCQPTDKDVTVDFDLVLAAEKGPAMQADTGTYRYFVAITDPKGAVLAKEQFDTTVDFTNGKRQAGSVEGLRQVIPLEAGQDPSAYQVLIGFQLTPDQLQFNRSNPTF